MVWKPYVRLANYSLTSAQSLASRSWLEAEISAVFPDLAQEGCNAISLYLPTVSVGL